MELALLKAMYEAERASEHRTYANTHNYQEWAHWMRVHVLGQGECPLRTVTKQEAE